MLKHSEFLIILEKFAPLSLSKLMIDNGSYDNSGALIKCSNQVGKILFSLDLSLETVNKAIELGCDTIVTHHPAIYNPIKSLDIDQDTAPVLYAVKNGLNVFSMHLNLDIANDGIDGSLALALGGENARIIDLIDGVHGYGREFKSGQNVNDFVNLIKKNLDTEKVVCYGEGVCNIVASFCGGGAGEALKAVTSGLTCADTVVTSDAPHHVVKELVERNVKLIIIPHYSAEEYGFNKFYARVKAELGDKAQAYYFQDKRFM
jgi:dinuclear metal center YbgI/SA1388 family protein